MARGPRRCGPARRPTSPRRSSSRPWGGVGPRPLGRSVHASTLRVTGARASDPGVHRRGTRWFVADPLRTVDAEPDLSVLRSVFQPIVDLATGAVVAHEGLTRGPPGAWHRPEDLFARARAAGHLAELDEHCRRLALATALAAGAAGPSVLFLNIEPDGIPAGPPPPDAVTFARQGGRIVLEFTERALTGDPARLQWFAGRLRHVGIAVALDDVGSHPASLALLPFLRPGGRQARPAPRPGTPRRGRRARRGRGGRLRRAQRRRRARRGHRDRRARARRPGPRRDPRPGLPLRPPRRAGPDAGHAATRRPEGPDGPAARGAGPAQPVRRGRPRPPAAARDRSRRCAPPRH